MAYSASTWRRCVGRTADLKGCIDGSLRWHTVRCPVVVAGGKSHRADSSRGAVHASAGCPTTAVDSHTGKGMTTLTTTSSPSVPCVELSPVLSCPPVQGNAERLQRLMDGYHQVVFQVATALVSLHKSRSAASDATPVVDTAGLLERGAKARQPLLPMHLFLRCCCGGVVPVALTGLPCRFRLSHHCCVVALHHCHAV